MADAHIYGFLAGIATNLASDLLNAGFSRFQTLVRGDAEERAWRRVFEAGFYYMLYEVANALDEMQQGHLGELFREFIQQVNVANILIDTAIRRIEPPIDMLRDEFSRQFDPDLLQFGEVTINFDSAIVALCQGLESATQRIASEPNSPLFSLVNLHGQERIESNTDQILELLTPFKDSNAQFVRLQQAIVSDVVRDRLEVIQRDWSTGRFENVLSTLNNFRNDQEKWEIVPPDVKARWLRTEGLFHLEFRNDVEVARQLLQQAREIGPDPDEDAYAQARIAFAEADYPKAQELIEGLTSEQAIHLRAAILIEHKQYQEARITLGLIGKSQNIHVHFTRARLALLQHEIETAIGNMQTALKIAPHSDDMLFWSAQLNYYISLSPAVQPIMFQSLPEPLSRELYRNTPRYLRYREEAEAIFHQLADNGKDTIRPSAQIWYLACLFNLPDKQEQAAAYCQWLIENNPHYDLAAVWGITRNLDIDYAAALQPLRAKVDDGEVLLNQVLSLANYYLFSKQAEEAISLLQRTEDVFRDGKMELWYDLMSKAHLSSGQVEQAEECLQNISDKQIKNQLRFSLFVRNRDKPAIENLLENELSDPVQILFACDYMANQGDLTWANRHAELLVKEISTELAFGLAIHATYSAMEIQRCLDLIDSISEQYHPVGLPWSYWNIRIRCLLEAGDFKEAYSEAKSLYDRSPNSETFITLVMVYQHLGDLESIPIIARDLLGEIEIPVREALKVAQLTSLHNLDLAIDLWRQIMKRDLPDESIIFAFMLANTFGTKAETKTLAERMQMMIENKIPGVWRITPQEGVNQLRDRHDFEISANQMYHQGNVPIHELAVSLGVPLAGPFHHNLSYIEENGGFHSSFVLMTRHGGRPFLYGFKQEDLHGHLALDISSILLAEHFGFLELVENTFAPIRLPQRIILALSEMLLRYHETDRENIEACKEIVRFAERNPNAIFSLPDLESDFLPLVDDLGQEWTQSYQFAKENEGYFVNFLPVRKRGLEFRIADLPRESDQYIIDARAIADALMKYLAITKIEHTQIVHSLGSMSNSGTSLVQMG